MSDWLGSTPSFSVRLVIALLPSVFSFWSHSGCTISNSQRGKEKVEEESILFSGTRLEMAHITSAHMGKNLETWPISCKENWDMELQASLVPGYMEQGQNGFSGQLASWTLGFS